MITESHYISDINILKKNLKRFVHVPFLEAKASKGMHQVCIEKSRDRHLSIHLR